MFDLQKFLTALAWIVALPAFFSMVFVLPRFISGRWQNVHTAILAPFAMFPLFLTVPLVVLLTQSGDAGKEFLHSMMQTGPGILLLISFSALIFSQVYMANKNSRNETYLYNEYLMLYALLGMSYLGIAACFGMASSR